MAKRKTKTKSRKRTMEPGDCVSFKRADGRRQFVCRGKTKKQMGNGKRYPMVFKPLGWKPR